jgi:branched-subunit amino acid transport protein AzlD
MTIQRFNWQIWAGFLLSVIAFLSYPLILVRFPVTRDFPWANLLLFGIAAALVLVGVRRAFTPDRRRISKIVSSILATLSVAILGFFIFAAFIMSRWLPASHGAPQIGQKAPAFNLLDTNSRMVSLSELLSTPIRGTAPKGVLLIFYRGYW